MIVILFHTPPNHAVATRSFFAMLVRSSPVSLKLFSISRKIVSSYPWKKRQGTMWIHKKHPSPALFVLKPTIRARSPSLLADPSRKASKKDHCHRMRAIACPFSPINYSRLPQPLHSGVRNSLAHDKRIICERQTNGIQRLFSL